MTLDGCGKFMKYSMFFVNFIIFLAGTTVVGLGIWAIVDGTEMNKVLGDSTYGNSAAVMLTFGGVVTFIAFLGCCGAIKEVKCLLMTFFIILLLITIGIVAAVVLAYKAKETLDTAFKDGLQKSMRESKSDNSVKEAWDKIQTELQCCGAVSYNDWEQAASITTPDSCMCDPGDGDDGRCQRSVGTEPSYWNNGCLESIKENLKKHATPLLGVGIAIVVIIILAMIFSCALFMML